MVQHLLFLNELTFFWDAWKLKNQCSAFEHGIILYSTENKWQKITFNLSHCELTAFKGK